MYNDFHPWSSGRLRLQIKINSRMNKTTAAMMAAGHATTPELAVLTRGSGGQARRDVGEMTVTCWGWSELSKAGNPTCKVVLGKAETKCYLGSGGVGGFRCFLWKATHTTQFDYCYVS